MSTKVLAILAAVASACFLVLVTLQIIEMKNYDAPEAIATSVAAPAAAPATAPAAAPAAAPK